MVGELLYSELGFGEAGAMVSLSLKEIKGWSYVIACDDTFLRHASKHQRRWLLMGVLLPVQCCHGASMAVCCDELYDMKVMVCSLYECTLCVECRRGVPWWLFADSLSGGCKTLSP